MSEPMDLPNAIRCVLETAMVDDDFPAVLQRADTMARMFAGDDADKSELVELYQAWRQTSPFLDPKKFKARGDKVADKLRQMGVI